MPCPGVGPCTPWDLDLSCCLVSGSVPDPCLSSGELVPQDLIDSSILAASQFMWAATGRQFGCCQVTVRPTQNPRSCDCEDTDFLWGYPWVPTLLSDGSWTNLSCLCGQDPCGCPEQPCEISLPYPVCSIDEVKVDGVVLGPTEYRVDNFRKLVRLKGEPFKVGPSDWDNPNVVENPGVSVQITDPAGGQIQLSGNISIQLNPFIGFNLPVVNAPALSFSMGQFNIQQPTDLKLCFLFDNTGDNITLNPAAVERVSGPATYDANTGVLTYTGAFPNAANLQQFIAQTVCVYFRQGFQASLITFPQPVTIWQVQWTNDEITNTCWPKCNNLALTDDEVGTMSVTLTYGRPIPELVRRATALFACELIKSCTGAPCQLPQRVTSISRQGVSVSFLDPQDFLEQGRTGLYLVDLAIKTYNPRGLLKNASVYSPDYRNRWRRTTWESTDPFGPGCT